MKHRQRQLDLDKNLKKFGVFRPEYPLSAHDVAYKDEEGNLYETRFRDYQRDQFRKYLKNWRKVTMSGSLKSGFTPYPEGYINYQICWNQKLITRKNRNEEYKTFPIFNYGSDAIVIDIKTQPANPKNPERWRKRTWFYFDSIDDDIACQASYYGDDQEDKAKAFRNFVTKFMHLEDFEDVLRDYVTNTGWDVYC